MDLRTLGKALELVLMRKEARSSLRKARIAQAPLLCIPGAVTLQSLAIPSAVPRSAHEEDMMSHGSHRQVSPSPWAPAADRSHFHSPKFSRDTGLHLPPQPQGRAACLPPSSTGVFWCITGEGETQAMEREISGHTWRKGRESGLDHPSDLPFASRMPQRLSLPACGGGSLEGGCF